MMLNDNVQIIDNIFPVDTNVKILEELSVNRWFIASDNINGKTGLQHITSKKNSGFFIETIKDAKIIIDSPLNIYGNIIFDIIKDKLNIKNSILIRLYWNMYFPGAETEIHTDSPRLGIKSAVYNMHTTDGGIMINDVFYPDKMGQAKIFNSNIKHKGIGPKEDNVRFNLNLMFTI